TVDFAAVFFDQLGVTLNHAADLLALIRVDQKDDFVMTHECSLRVVACRSKTVRQGVNDTYGSCRRGGTSVPARKARGAIVEKGEKRRKVIGDYLNNLPNTTKLNVGGGLLPIAGVQSHHL